MKVIVFTGAGASRPLNYPTTAEFFSDKSLSKEQENFFNTLKKYLNVNIVDVEDALYILDKCNEFLDTKEGGFAAVKLTENWKNRIEEFTSYCQERCFHLYGSLPEERDVEELYTPLFDIIDWNNNETFLFTANYDPVTDTIMDIAEKNHISSYDGFGSRGDWRPKGYINPNGLNIYRIHGSMSWVQQGDKIRNTRDYSVRASNNHEHLIIYPGYKGNPEFDAHEVFNYPHKALREKLQEADVLLSIGFSFRDIHLNEVFQSAMKENKYLKLIVLNPSWPEGEGDVMNIIRKEYSSRVFHIDSKFGDDLALSKLSKIIKKT